jgi:hypothetical protein
MKLVRLLVVIAAVVAVILLLVRANDQSAVIRSSGVSVDKPTPISPGFRGCPGDGDGGDRPLNRLKNRVDSAEWVVTPFSAVLNLSWPRSVARYGRNEWSSVDAKTVAASEGLPVAVEGYFVAAKQEGPEATNCHGADAAFRDWHLWLAASPGKDRRRSIVTETTPAIRDNHPEWTLNAIHKLVRDSTLVRVSGWLLLDQEHLEQLGKSRGTLWEIHPVMRIELWRNGRWEKMREGSGAGG